MDPEVSLLFDCKHWRGLRESQVQVELSESFNRRTDAALDRHIGEVWTERVSKEPWLFNGAKFRLHSFSFASAPHTSPSRASPERPPCADVAQTDRVQDEEDKSARRPRLATRNTSDRTQRSETVDDVVRRSVDAPDCTSGQRSGPPLTLRLGLTCYKDYLGTNWSRRVSELRRRGESEFGDSAALLAQPLGVGAVLRTRDGQVVLIRRSREVAEAGGLLDIPGGHPEPKVVCERLGLSSASGDVNMATVQQRPRAVISELFASVCAEIRDEVNVPLGCLGEPVLMGVALNHTSAGRPSAEFYVRCSLTSDEVRALYWKGGAEAEESTDIVFLSREEVQQLDQVNTVWTQLCPSAKGAVLLYQLVKPDGE